MPYFEEPSGKFYYRHWDCETPRACVLLLHGFGEHSGHYHRFASALVHANLDVWALDHVGHGLTGGTPGRFESIEQLARHASSLAQLITQSHPDLPLIVCGHSLGGITASRLALDLKETPAGLVLTGTPFEGLPPIDETMELVMSTDAAYLDALDTDPHKFDTGPAEQALWDAIRAETSLLRSGLKRLTIPTLLINGEHDVFAPPKLAREWANTMLNATAVEISGGYHDIPNDSAHRKVIGHIVSSIDKWLSDFQKTGARIEADPAIP